LYPQVLPASTGNGLSLTIYNTAAGAHALTRGIYWWARRVGAANDRDDHAAR
jgi:hypothetical protein